MKKVLGLMCSFFLVTMAMAQNEPYINQLPYIEVTGSAEMEIEPDEIRLAITIANYEEEKTKRNVKLEEVEKRMMDILSNIGLSSNSIVLKNASTQSYWYDLMRGRREKNEPRVTKQYEVILTDSRQLNKVLAELPGPKEGVLEVNISELKNKNIAEYRKQVKIEAIKAAKEKAQYLLESVGSNAGKLIQVIELDEDNMGWYRPASAVSNTVLQASGNDDQDPSMQKIKLRYRIKARFMII